MSFKQELSFDEHVAQDNLNTIIYSEKTLMKTKPKLVIEMSELTFL